MLALIQRFRLDLRPTGRLQILLSNGLRITGLQQLLQNFLAHLAAIPLTNYAVRNLSRSETLYFCGAANGKQPVTHFFLNSTSRNLNPHASFKSCQGLNRNLHIVHIPLESRLGPPARCYAGQLGLGAKGEIRTLTGYPTGS